MTTSQSLYGSGSTTKKTTTTPKTSQSTYGSGSSNTTSSTKKTTTSSGTLGQGSVAYNTLSNSLNQGTINKSDLSNFTNLYMSAGKKLGIDYNDPKNYAKILASMDPKVVAQYGSVAGQLQNALQLSGIEGSYGSSTANLLSSYTDPEQASAKYSQILESVQNDPKFQEFWNKYKTFVEDNYSIKVESLQKQLDYALKENTMATTQNTAEYGQDVQDINKNYEFSLTDINQQKKEASQEYGNLEEDVNKYIAYANSDYVNSLAKVDTNVAESLQKATESYGQRNLLNSGIQSQGVGKLVNDSTSQKIDLATDKTRTIDKYSTELTRGKQTLQNILDKLSTSQSKAEYGKSSSLTKAERDYLYNQSRLNLESGKLKDLNDIAIRQASKDREQSLYDIQNKSLTQAYSIANSQFSTEQSKTLSQILSSMIQ